ncbi:hypothetical protein [Pontibacter korlensis]|nr:hypothetical protein [Pontibacter korlensis]
MRRTLLLMLLCSCATQRQAEKFFDEHPEELAVYIDNNEAYTKAHGGTYAAKHFPSKLQAPTIQPKQSIYPEKSVPLPMLISRPGFSFTPVKRRCPDCRSATVTKTVYLQDTALVNALRTELHQERQEHGKVRHQLKRTKVERDYWREMNRKKFWTLIAMGIFAVLYILFRLLASRVREREE